MGYDYLPTDCLLQNIMKHNGNNYSLLGIYQEEPFQLQENGAERESESDVIIKNSIETEEPRNGQLI